MNIGAIGVILLSLIILCCGETINAQEDGLIKRTSFWKYTYENRSGPFKEFGKLYLGLRTTEELYGKYLRTRRTQRIINYSCAGAVLGIGCAMGILAINPYNSSYFVNLAFPLYGVTVIGGITTILTNAIILPIQSNRKRRIISRVNIREIGESNNEQSNNLALGFSGLGAGLYLTF